MFRHLLIVPLLPVRPKPGRAPPVPSADCEVSVVENAFTEHLFDVLDFVLHLA